MMLHVISCTGWSREYVAWNTNYPWIVRMFDYHKKTPPPQRSIAEVNSILKAVFSVKESESTNSGNDEAVKADDVPMLASMETVTMEQAASKLKQIGIHADVMGALKKWEQTQGK